MAYVKHVYIRINLPPSLFALSIQLPVHELSENNASTVICHTYIHKYLLSLQYFNLEEYENQPVHHKNRKTIDVTKTQHDYNNNSQLH